MADTNATVRDIDNLIPTLLNIHPFNTNGLISVRVLATKAQCLERRRSGYYRSKDKKKLSVNTPVFQQSRPSRAL